MPSTGHHSPGPSDFSSAGFQAPENTGNADCLAALRAESEAAADRLVASIDWDAHDAALAELAADHLAAMHFLALHEKQEAEHTAGTGPVVEGGSGDITT
jgi:hypothetical protein